MAEMLIQMRGGSVNRRVVLRLVYELYLVQK